MNKGCMPRTDFTYEEFEGLLASFYLSLLPMRSSARKRDAKEFKSVVSVLNGFAKRYGVQKPKDAIAHPRPTEHKWGRAQKLEANMMLDALSSFWRDFGIGADPKSFDGQERYRLGRLLLGILHRHGALKAKFDIKRGKRVAVGIESWNREKEFSLLF